MTVKRFEISHIHENLEDVNRQNLQGPTPIQGEALQNEDLLRPHRRATPDEILQTNIGPFNENARKFSNGDGGHESMSKPFHNLPVVGGFEEILKQLGCFGPFQVLTLLSYLFMEFAAAFVVFMPIFDARVASNNSQTCDQENYTDFGENFHQMDFNTFNESEPFYKEVEVVPSSSFSCLNNIFALFYQHGSIIEEWGLVCDKAWIPDIFTSCMMAGMIIGNLTTSQLADWYGRRKIYLFSVFLMFTGTAMSAFSPSVYVYAAARFICGIGFCGFMNISSMAVMEFMTPKWRSFATCVGPMGEGLMLLSLLAYFIRPWRLLYLASLVPYIFVIPVYIFLPESPRWLLRNNKMTEAHAVLGYMAKINGKQPVTMDVLEALRRQEEKESECIKSKKLSYMEFIRNKTLFVTSVYMFAIWFSWNVSYYGITFNIRNVQGNKYINVALIGLANAIGQRAAMPVSDIFGRRKAVLFAKSLSAIFLVSLAICFLTIDVSSYLILVACFFGLLGMACTRACARLLSGESFPTAVRTMGLGIGGLGANIAGLVTPQIAYLGSQRPALPFFIFAVFSVFGALVVFMMKETNGAPLTDEVKAARRKKSIIATNNANV